MAEIDFMSMYKKAKQNRRSKLQNTPLEKATNFSPILVKEIPLIVKFQANVLTHNKLQALIQDLQSCALEWNVLSGRNVLLLGGVPHPNGAILEGLPHWAQDIASKLSNSCFASRVPNQILVNSYDCGQGIGHHCDGPLYAPYVAILSLTGGAKINFIPLKSDASTDRTADEKVGDYGDAGPFSIYLPPNSLLAFSESVYRDYTHGIEPCAVDIIDGTCCNTLEAGVELGQEIPRAAKRNSLTFRFLELIDETLDEFGACTTEMKEELIRRKDWWLRAITETDVENAASDSEF